jgi:hypothetical protein
MDVMLVKILLLGAITLGFTVAGLFFLQFWHVIHDRLFLCFPVAFSPPLPLFPPTF